MAENGVNFQKFAKEVDVLLEMMSLYKEIPRSYESDIPLYPAEVHIMCHIAEGISAVTDLANHEKKSKSAMSQIITRMEKKGFVEKYPNPTNRRAFFLRLTEKGERIVDAHTRMNQKIYREVWEKMNISQEDRMQAVSSFLHALSSTYAQMLEKS